MAQRLEHDEAAVEGGRREASEPALAAMRERLERALHAVSEARARLDGALLEAGPFVEAVRRAQGHGAPPTEEARGSGAIAWREARSLAWLLGYRLGDQQAPVALAAALLPAWRDATNAGAALCDELQGLVLDGFTRGREDRQRAETQAALAAALFVGELGRGVLAALAGGALEVEGARAFAERASAALLRSGATAAVLDLTGLREPSAATLHELWSVAGAARMLGVPLFVSGLEGALAELVAAAGLSDEGEVRVASLALALERAARVGARDRGARLAHWLRRLFAREAQG